MDVSSAEQAQRFEEVLDAFPLVDAADEQETKRAGGIRPAVGRGREAGGVDAVRNHGHGAGGSAVFDQGGAGKRGSGQKVCGHGGLANEVLEVLLGEGELPLLAEGAGAVRMSVELPGEDAAHAGGVRVELEQYARMRVVGEGVVAVVAVAEEASAGAIGEATGGATERGVGGAGDAAAKGQRRVRKFVEQKCGKAGQGARMDERRGEMGLAALREHGAEGRGEAGPEILGPGTIRGPKEVGDECLEHARVRESARDLVGISCAALDHHGLAGVRGGGGGRSEIGLGQGGGHGRVSWCR